LRLVRPVYRAHHPRWSFQPESGDGAARFGGRFNPVGTPALYTSLRLETAWLEAQQGFPFKAQPMTLCAYEVDCDNMLDLTDAAMLASLDLSPEDLACPWEILAAKGIRPPTWLLAERLKAAGHSGIVTPSFAPGASAADVNVTFWRWSDMEPHRVRVIDHLVRLPRDDRSWRLEP
jgi:RES domain-containing protein